MQTRHCEKRSDEAISSSARFVCRALAALVISTMLAACAAPKDAPGATMPATPVTVGEVSLASPKEIRALVEAGKGSVVVVNIWATFCPPCVREMPELAAFYREFDGKGVTFLSIGADLPTAKDEVVVPWMKSYEIPFPVRIMVAEDADTINQDLALDWDGSLPATFIYAPDGTLAWSGIGQSVTYESLVDRVKLLRASIATL